VQWQLISIHGKLIELRYMTIYGIFHNYWLIEPKIYQFLCIFEFNLNIIFDYTMLCNLFINVYLSFNLHYILKTIELVVIRDLYRDKLSFLSPFLSTHSTSSLLYLKRKIYLQFWKVQAKIVWLMIYSGYFTLFIHLEFTHFVQKITFNLKFQHYLSKISLKKHWYNLWVKIPRFHIPLFKHPPTSIKRGRVEKEIKSKYFYSHIISQIQYNLMHQKQTLCHFFINIFLNKLTLKKLQNKMSSIILKKKDGW